jgi:hypothetical protein
MPFDNLKDSLLLGVFVRAAHDQLKEIIARNLSVVVRRFCDFSLRIRPGEGF